MLIHVFGFTHSGDNSLAAENLGKRSSENICIVRSSGSDKKVECFHVNPVEKFDSLSVSQNGKYIKLL